MVKPPKKRILFNHFSVDIIVLPDDDERYVFQLEDEKFIINGDEAACCFEGDRGKPFAIAFRHGEGWREVVHECWHLYFKILRYMGGFDDVSYKTLETEIYAYRFTDLCDLVYETLKQLDKEKKDG